MKRTGGTDDRPAFHHPKDHRTGTPADSEEPEEAAFSHLEGDSLGTDHRSVSANRNASSAANQAKAAEVKAVLPSAQTRKVVLTFAAAGIGAVIVEHYFKPKLKKGLFL